MPIQILNYLLLKIKCLPSAEQWVPYVRHNASHARREKIDTGPSPITREKKTDFNLISRNIS